MVVHGHLAVSPMTEHGYRLSPVVNDCAAAHGKSTDATQEIIALGIGNIAGSFVGSMPISASFGRSAVQSSSGVRTTMANVFSSEYNSSAMFVIAVEDPVVNLKWSVLTILPIYC